MIDRKKIQYIQKVLDYYYPSPPVPLDSTNHFTFLVAVVLSAQTTDGKVNEVTKELFALASTAQEMAKLTPTKVQSIIQPVGLAPKKAQYLVDLSRMLVEKFNGTVPSSYEDLESLPGVGHKTASVIRSQLYDEPAFAVDTHVHRLALRWGLSKEQNVNKVQIDLCNAFPRDCWNKLHLQMIYFGREYCAAKEHKPNRCPICSWIKCSEDKALPDPASNNNFDVAKRVKGIVYYRDRIEQLTNNPALAHNSPIRPGKRNKIETKSTTRIIMKSEGSNGDAIEKCTEPQKRQPKHIKRQKVGNNNRQKDSSDSVTINSASRSTIIQNRKRKAST